VGIIKVLLTLELSASLLAVGARAATSFDALSAPVFPLKVGADGRYLVDQRNTPFLVVGDSPWSLIVQTTERDLERYLDDRRTRGFNSIIVNLIEHKFCNAPPKTRSGIAPFLKTGDFASPNTEYFDFARRIVQKANEVGIVVWLAPAYLGFGGGDEGFFQEMKAGGKEKLRVYGEFVGRQFKDVPNIVWLLGGDFTPEKADRWTVTELAAGILQQDTNHLMTVHDAPENAAASIFGDYPWLGVNTVYSYEQTLFRPVLAEFGRQPTRPFVLIETTYEGEHNSTPDQIRRQAYWAMLGGACGQFMGNNPVWHCDGPGLFPAKMNWIEALDSAASRDLARLRMFFLELPWYDLRPESNHELIVSGFGTNVNTALTALNRDKTLSVTYIPSTGTGARTLSVDTSRLAGSIAARWFNPVGGGYRADPGLEEGKKGLHLIRTPGDNGSGANDWVLILNTQ
jgi:hypothetical protein